MFKRLIYDNWTTIVPIASFILTFSVFLVICAGAIFMKKNKIEQLADLPLE